MAVAALLLKMETKSHYLKKLDQFKQNLVCWCIVALPTIKTIESTEIGNKTANKKISLSIMLTATGRKLQKS